MIIHKGYKFRLKIKPAVEQQLLLFSGHCRFVWNQFWRMNQYRLEHQLPILRYQEMAFWLKLWKQTDERDFLKRADSQALQQTLKDLDRAYRDGFDKSQPQKRLPTPRRRGRRDSFRFPQRFKVEGNRVYLPKIGWVRFHKSRDLQGLPKNVTVSRRGRHWYVSIQTEQVVADPVHPAESIVGIDLGVAKFAALSDGTDIPARNSFKVLEKKLARAQRDLSRKQKFSSNWCKQKARVARLHERIADTRRDFLHKQSTFLCNNHAGIVLEDLKVANMSRSAKGSLDAPGRNVKAKAGLNKAILDQGWSMFRAMLEYKQAWRGGMVVAVPPRHTSQTCACCGHVAPENRKSQADFVCVSCGHSDNADTNAARNILAAGHAVLACGAEALASAVKQEPQTAASAA